jgi:hypothetical protein
MTAEELTDFLETTIDDSFDLGWTSLDAAKLIVSRMQAEGLVLIERERIEARIEEVENYHKKRLGTYKAALEMLNEATARAEAAEAELERRKYDRVHTCHAECQRKACVLRREVDALRAELAEARASERAVLVAWLRLPNHRAYHPLADAIEAGEHLTRADPVRFTLGDSDGDDGA